MMGGAFLRGSWKYYYVHLGGELGVGERSKVEIVQELHDTEGSFEPFLAKTVIEPLDYLTLSVQLPRHQLPAEITFTEERAAIPGNDVIKRKPGKCDSSTGVISWNIQSPVFGHRYEIRWK